MKVKSYIITIILIIIFIELSSISSSQGVFNLYYDFSQRRLRQSIYIDGTELEKVYTLAEANLDRIRSLWTTAQIAAALSLEALVGISDAFDSRIQEVRPYPGQIEAAREILYLIERSSFIDSTRLTKDNPEGTKVQDAYSLRAIPQVHGAVMNNIYLTLDILNKYRAMLDSGQEINPEDIESLSLIQNILAVSVTVLANISERRVFRVISPKSNEHLPAFSVEESGTNSGTMITQYLAAQLVALNKILSGAISVKPPTASEWPMISLDKLVGERLGEIIDNVEICLAVELLVSFLGTEFRLASGGSLGKGTQIAYDIIKGAGIEEIGEDRQLSRVL